MAGKWSTTLNWFGSFEAVETCMNNLPQIGIPTVNIGYCLLNKPIPEKVGE